MNVFVLLSLQERIAQCGAGKHDQWQGYMTVLVINHGSIKSITILSAVIHPMIKFELDKQYNCFRKVVKWTLTIH
jgi:hypothetical protein